MGGGEEVGEGSKFLFVFFCGEWVGGEGGQGTRFRGAGLGGRGVKTSSPARTSGTGDKSRFLPNPKTCSRRIFLYPTPERHGEASKYCSYFVTTL
jgi:hypothetical protein